MSPAASVLTNPVVAGLVIPGGAVVATTYFKVSASRNNPSANDWVVGFDLLLAAVALQLVYLASDYEGLRMIKASSVQPSMSWLNALGWLTVLAIAGVTAGLAGLTRAFKFLWRRELSAVWDDEFGRNVDRIEWILRSVTAFLMSLFGGLILTLVYLANTYPGYIYYHASWLRGI